ncbi:TIGR03986 family CRISPR-associated RAMP protein [Streptomyces sp. NPDC002742]|uniref:TIGR03986 family type III CRISPR-associated RAMP protein n=1 Tax=Streptomyces sp. NPDC002742 TaxID=3364663 RepID=UPI00368EA96C
MADRSGQLRWDSAKAQLFVDGDGASRPYRVKDAMLGPELGPQASAHLDGLRVDYDWPNGQPKNVRPHGAAGPQRRPKPAARPPAGSEEFVNPYLFIPARPRTGRNSDLGDRRPGGHHRIRPDRWSGRIAVTLTVNTPLLLLDTARAQHAANGHATYPVLMRDGSPHLPATSVKGMLRAAYEAVTNSRFGVFAGHGDRLGHRRDVGTSKGMVPARISDDETEVVLLPGDTPVGGQSGRQPVMHAAWLPQYRKGQPTPQPRIRYSGPGARAAVHGDFVEAEVELRRHRSNNFQYWQVLPGTLTPLPASAPCRPSAAPTAGGERKTIRGWVFISNQNMGNKHDERIFFTCTQDPVPHPLTPALATEWENLIRDYRQAHRPQDINERPAAHGNGRARPQDFLGHEPGKTAWSPHQYDDAYLRLKAGTLCYAAVEGGKITGLYPVAVSRALFDKPPKDLLHPTLAPASTPDELSPADRVFGWVNPAGSGAYRGQLRIGPVTCDTDPSEAIEEFPGDGVALAVLSNPKPQQGRFYLTPDQNAPQQPLPAGTPKAKWFTGKQGPRGRKAYWHHAALPDGYWDNPAPGGHTPEYRRPDGEDKNPVRDDQNRSVLGWIRPGTRFRLTLDVDNLTDTELGALTWLLTLPEQHFHRLGHGKPLGFGSVRLDIDPERTDLGTGGHWRTYYRTLAPAPQRAAEPPDPLCRRLAAAFEELVRGRPGGPCPELDAFRAAARGTPGSAVHYPRTTADPGPETKSYEWFVENEREKGGPRLSLPSWHTPQLPIDPSNHPSGRQPHRGTGHRPAGKGKGGTAR